MTVQISKKQIATDPRSGVDLASLAELLQRHPVKACWLMPNFQNPLGSLMPVVGVTDTSLDSAEVPDAFTAAIL